MRTDPEFKRRAAAAALRSKHQEAKETFDDVCEVSFLAANRTCSQGIVAQPGQSSSAFIRKNHWKSVSAGESTLTQLPET